MSFVLSYVRCSTPEYVGVDEKGECVIVYSKEEAVQVARESDANSLIAMTNKGRDNIPYPFVIESV